MPKKGKLSGAWADMLPQESTKRKVIPHEKKPWGCRYCKSPLIRFSTPANLRMHVSKKHPLLKKGGLRDLEPPSAQKGFPVSFHSKLECSARTVTWNVQNRRSKSVLCVFTWTLFTPLKSTVRFVFRSCIGTWSDDHLLRGIMFP